MASNQLLSTIQQKWVGMNSKTRTVVSAVVVLSVVMLVGLMFTGKITPIETPTPESHSELKMPGTQKDVTLERLAGDIQAMAQEQKRFENDQKNQQDATSKAIQQMQVDSKSTPNQQIVQIQQKLDALETRQASAPPPANDPLADPALGLPVDSKNQPLQPVDSQAVNPAPSKPSIRVIAGNAPPVEADDASETAKETPYLPIGSMFDGILLNGMEAPTSQVTMKNPVPALIRIKSDAILPNEYRKDVRECFLIVSGFGVLSTERAQLRTENISCVRKDGGVLEAKVHGYVVGEDGKVGLRGKLISKQGQLIAQSLMVGFVQGIGNAMQPMAVPAYNMSPGGTQQYQMPSMSMMGMAGMAGGISNAANSIAQFYLSMAQQMFPVVEVDAGRKVTIILNQGFAFDLSGKSKAPAQEGAQNAK
ncbi:TraB/VirB10 family protein [Ferrovum sp.]|uniref:TraB/VirB10 family protein n=1 Tax=Ferrovum sp. TaxID=2609467 RepID=UPI0026105DA5|nr:TraB/VirB10 family protein [Ferrovum sp.]